MMVTNFDIDRFFSAEGGAQHQKDLVPVESPLEVLLYSHKKAHYSPFTVLMRTPSHDVELVIGFLFTEQLITSITDIVAIFYCKKVAPEHYGNTIKVMLQAHLDTDALLANRRNFTATSSCGICGDLMLKNRKIEKLSVCAKDILCLDKHLIFTLSNASLKQQTAFRHTGGIHASSLFSYRGKLLWIAEDIGRHNALDKLIGHAVQNHVLDQLQVSLLLLSGRVSYELIQKAAIARIPIICALGSPSSLAVQWAKALNITLIAFLNDKKFNVYNRAEYVVFSEKKPIDKCVEYSF